MNKIETNRRILKIPQADHVTKTRVLDRQLVRTCKIEGKSNK